MARFKGRSKWWRPLLYWVLVVTASILANIAVRTTQTVLEGFSAPLNWPNPCVEALATVAPYIARQLGAKVQLAQIVSPEGDADGDGLSPLQEFLQMTADDCRDCDGDGIPDGADQCPDCWITSYTDRVESEVVRGLFGKSAQRTKNTVYVPVGWNGSLDVGGTPYRLVPSSEWHFRLVQRYFGYVPRTGSQVSWLYLKPRVIVPGAFYVYRATMICGDSCGWGKLAVLIDIPILGPVYVGSKLVWVS